MGQNDKKGDKEYIHNLARTMMGQLGISLETLQHHSCPDDRISPAARQFGEMVWIHNHHKICEKVWGFTPETRGRIAEYGLPTSDGSADCTLYGVHQTSRWLDGMRSGKELVTLIAVTTIVAAMVDNLRDDHNRLTAVQNSIDPGPDERVPYTTSLYSGSGHITPKPGLDFYDGNRDRQSGGELVPYQGSFGKYGE